MIEEDPSGARFVAACFLTAAVAPVPAALTLLSFVPPSAAPGTAFGTLVLGMPVALAHLLLALPVYSLLRRRWRLDWWNSMFGGMLVGALPVAVLLPEWEVIMVGAACGAAGGLTFWAVLRWLSPAQTEDAKQKAS